jgi:hypothetical protein
MISSLRYNARFGNAEMIRSIRQTDKLALATHPLDIERITGSKLRPVREQKNIRALAVRDRV